MPTFGGKYHRDYDYLAGDLPGAARERFSPEVSPPVEPTMTITLTKSDYDDLAELVRRGKAESYSTALNKVASAFLGLNGLF